MGANTAPKATLHHYKRKSIVDATRMLSLRIPPQQDPNMDLIREPLAVSRIVVVVVIMAIAVVCMTR